MSIPIILITGYLGAGKTTLLGNLLAMDVLREKRLSLVINEFSVLGVDGKLLQPGRHAMFEISRGSVFCTCTRTDMLRVLQEIAAMEHCDAVILEATGISKTGDIDACLQLPGVAGEFAVQTNLCLVDALNFTKVAGFLPAVQSQVQCADVLVVNKADLVPEAELARLQAILKRMNPAAAQVVTSFGRISGDVLMAKPSGSRPVELLSMPPEAIYSIAFQSQEPLDRDRFLAIVESLGMNLLRLKGNIDFGEGLRFVELVGDQILEKPACEQLSSQTAFSAIAWQVNSEELRSRFAQAARCPHRQS